MLFRSSEGFNQGKKSATGMTVNDFLSRLPKNVLVYDRSRKEIVEYYGTPEKIGNSLVLHDANTLNIEDVSHLVE